MWDLKQVHRKDKGLGMFFTNLTIIYSYSSSAISSLPLYLHSSYLDDFYRLSQLQKNKEITVLFHKEKKIVLPTLSILPGSCVQNKADFTFEPTLDF